MDSYIHDIAADHYRIDVPLIRLVNAWPFQPPKFSAWLK